MPTAAERNGDFSAIAGSLTGVVQGPAWAQQLSTTLGYAVTQGEPYYTTGCADTATCVFPGVDIFSNTAFTVPSQNLMQFMPPENAGPVIFFCTSGAYSPWR